MNDLNNSPFDPENDYIIPRVKLDYIFERLNEADSILMKLIEGKTEAFDEAKCYLWSASRIDIEDVNQENPAQEVDKILEDFLNS